MRKDSNDEKKLMENKNCFFNFCDWKAIWEDDETTQNEIKIKEKNS